MHRPLVVPIASIRLPDTPVARKWGFGGQSAQQSPIYRFFNTYLQDPAKAFEAFSRWLHERLITHEEWRVPKSEGGMKDGSIVNIALSLHDKNGMFLNGSLAKADPVLVKEAIDLRVQRYFDLFDSIRTRGFDYRWNDPIFCRQRDGLYHLVEGHHRTAAAAVLGYKEIAICARRRLFEF